MRVLIWGIVIFFMIYTSKRLTFLIHYTLNICFFLFLFTYIYLVYNIELYLKETEMNVKKRPLGLSITLVFAIFIVILTSILSLSAYLIMTASMYDRYNHQMESILEYIQNYIDDDDMSECAKTFTESEKYKETRIVFDRFIDHYTDAHYLYILKPVDDPARVRSVLSANSTYEKENEPENVIYIGDGDESWYTEESAARFRKILEGDKDVYFTETTEWGTDYTLARPLINSAGEHYAILCVDISIDEIRNTIYRDIMTSICIIVLMSLLFVIVIIAWVRNNVTIPIRKLKESVEIFANSSAGLRDPENLLFIPPEINTGNEVQALSEAVTKLASDMKEYVKDIVKAEDKAHGLEVHVSEMNTIAYQDALTLVKNKAAYEKKAEEIDERIGNGIAVFAIVMADLNGLKKMNDRYGHDKGDQYIKGTCEMISDVFSHSPVYRVGGDEFVIILEGRDYRDRNELLETIRTKFRESYAKSELVPWNRYWAALGMAVYDCDTDRDINSVFQRADHEMYIEKTRMKSENQKPAEN